MKKLLSNVKTLIALALVTLLTLGFYAYMLIRPISYGMEYHNVTEYESGTFEGTLVLNPDDTMINRNTNFEEELKSFYYYKDGYVFFTLAETREDYETEVAWINENFDEAIATPFYADKINAFEIVMEESDGYKFVYTCSSAVVFAIVVGVVELLLITATVISWSFYKKSKSTER